MTSVADTSLRPAERRVLDRFVSSVAREYGDDARGIWLYGSRARGEPPGPESDVDVLLVIRKATLDDHFRTGQLMDEAAEAEGVDPFLFSVRVYTPERLAQRREIRSFFIQEVDRDKVVLAGEA